MKNPCMAGVFAIVVSTLATGCAWVPSSWTSWASSHQKSEVELQSGGDPLVARLLDAEVARPMAPYTRADGVPAPRPVLIGPLVTIDSYEGDASILLKRIASANGRTFEVLGTEPRLPLFVHVHAINKDIKSVLADIGSQFGGRADLVLTPSQIQIQYKRAKTL